MSSANVAVKALRAQARKVFDLDRHA